MDNFTFAGPRPRAQRERRYRERPARAHRCAGRPSHGDGARAARGGGAHRDFLILEFFAIKKKRRSSTSMVRPLINTKKLRKTKTCARAAPAAIHENLAPFPSSLQCHGTRGAKRRRRDVHSAKLKPSIILFYYSIILFYS